MYNYITSEIYRLVHKKSVHYFFIYYVLYISFFCFRLALTESELTYKDSLDLFNIFDVYADILVGIISVKLFYDLYVEDIIQKVYRSAINSGISLFNYLFSKLTIFTITLELALLLFIVVFKVCLIVMFNIGADLDFKFMKLIFTISFQVIISACISSFCLILFHRRVLAVLIYLGLYYGVIDQIIYNTVIFISENLAIELFSKLISGRLMIYFTQDIWFSKGLFFILVTTVFLYFIVNIFLLKKKQ